MWFSPVDLLPSSLSSGVRSPAMLSWVQVYVHGVAAPSSAAAWLRGTPATPGGDGKMLPAFTLCRSPVGKGSAICMQARTQVGQGGPAVPTHLG